jgi:hypothetical protein
MDDTPQGRFKREILVHEEILMRFLARAWPRAGDWPDIRQEAYARVGRGSTWAPAIHSAAVIIPSPFA